MGNIIDKFCDHFPNIKFDTTKEKNRLQISIESAAVGEREITRMLNDAIQQLSKFKRLHKAGRVSSDEVFDCEWRVSELEEELRRFKTDLNTNDLEEDLL